MSDEHELTDTEEETEKVLNAFINKWLVRGAKFLLTVLVGGMITLATTLNQTVNNIKADSQVQKEKIEENTKNIEVFKKQIDDLHWYLIRANHVKVPENKDKDKSK